MASNKIVRFGPSALASSAANVLNPPTVTGGTGVAGTNTSTYVVVRHIRIVNKTASAATCSFWLGATGASAAGTEVIGSALSISANSYIDWYGQLRLDTADYLVGLASGAATLTFEAEGEIGIA
jgi:hypothetical protein